MFCSTTFRSSKNITSRTYTVDSDEIFLSDEAFVPYTQNAAGDKGTNAVYKGRRDGRFAGF